MDMVGMRFLMKPGKNTHIHLNSLKYRKIEPTLILQLDNRLRAVLLCKNGGTDMDIHKRAGYLESVFKEVTDAKRDFISQAEGRILNWYGLIEPIMAIMDKYGAPYANAKLPDCQPTLYGVLIGADEGKVFVLRDGLVCPVDRDTGVKIESGCTTLAAFLATADLNIIKAGFEYVSHLDSSAAEKIRLRNDELKRFLASTLKQ